MDLSAVIDFIAAHRAWALPLIFLVSFGESFAFLSLAIPGTTILAACGALVPSGTLSIWPLLAGAIPGAVLGDGISYWLGRRYGTAITGAWPLSRHPGMVEAGERFLRRHGWASVAIGRFFGPVRAVIPLVAGVAHMDRRQFWIANVLSAFVWAPAVMLPGALLGWAADRADATEQWMMAGAVAAVAVVAGIVVLRRRRAGIK